MTRSRPDDLGPDLYRAILLPARPRRSPTLIVESSHDAGDDGGNEGDARQERPLLTLAVETGDLDTVLRAHGWIRCSPWWLTRAAATCRVVPRTPDSPEARPSRE